VVYSCSGIHNTDFHREGSVECPNRKRSWKILILRQQLAIFQRKQEKPVKSNRAEKMMLAILTAKLKAVTRWSNRAVRSILRIVQPETVLGWHHDWCGGSGAMLTGTKVAGPKWIVSLKV